MSYAAASLVSPDQSTDALFRVWGSALSAALASMGLVQSGDPQTNWATVVRGTLAANTSWTSEVWTFNDSLQSSKPIYVKVEYGSGGNASGLSPSIWITVGSGSNGSGTITGQVGTRRQLGSGTTTATGVTTKNCIFSGSTNRMGAVMFNQSIQSFAFWLERTKNTDGTDSSLGAVWAGCDFSGGSAIRVQQFIPWAGAIPAVIASAANQGLEIIAPSNATVGAVGADLALYPVLHPSGGSYLNAMLGLVGYFNTDITIDSTFTMTMYGATHTYYPLSLFAASAFATGFFRTAVPAGGAVAMLYE